MWDERRVQHVPALAETIAFVRSLMPVMALNLGLDERSTWRLFTLMEEALFYCADMQIRNQSEPLLAAVSMAARLFGLMMSYVIDQSSRVEGEKDLKRALEFKAGGGNVAIAMNHFTSLDPAFVQYLVNQRFEGCAEDWVTVLNANFNDDLVSAMLSGGLRRLRVHTIRAFAVADARAKREMIAFNAKARSRLAGIAGEGGLVFTICPEGKKSGGELLRGQAGTMHILQAAKLASPEGFMVIPCYVDARPTLSFTTDRRQILSSLKKGEIRCRFGRPALWRELQPSLIELQAAEEAWRRDHADGEADSEHLLEQAQVHRIMRMIADLAPDNQRGYYLEP